MTTKKETAHTKRKKNIRLAVVLTLLLTAALVVVFVLVSPKDETYKPGEEIEGLTDDLGRELPEDHPKVTFTDVTAETGIGFKHFHGQRSTQLPEDMGPGAAWGDYNNDGFEDLFIANFSGPLDMTEEEAANSPARCVLYRNNGDGTFAEAAEEAGLDIRGSYNSAAWCDYNRDGRLDILITALGKNRLFTNNGNGTFKEETDQSGIGTFRGYWAGVNWGDFNNDGWPDIYITGYVRYAPQDPGQKSLQVNAEVPVSLNPSSFKPERNLLFRNNKDGSFTEMAAEAGVANEQGRSLAAVWVDINHDGQQDLYVANDVSDNVLYLNQGDGTFEDVSHAALVADYRGAMGIAVADWDNDTDLDMFITHWIAQENALYNNMAAQVEPQENLQPRFMDQADRYGLGQIALDYIGFGTSFLDFDNDGRTDIFVANGSTFQQRDSVHLLVPMKDQLFWNRSSDEGYFDVSRVSGDYFRTEQVGRGSAHADFDNDGDLDLVVVNNCGGAVLLRNDGGNTSGWLQVRLKGKESNPEGIGALLRLYAGGTVQTRSVGAQGSYFSQHTLTEHFGLGKGQAIDSLSIVWPSGARQTIKDLELNTRYMIEESGLTTEIE